MCLKWGNNRTCNHLSFHSTAIALLSLGYHHHSLDINKLIYFLTHVSVRPFDFYWFPLIYNILLENIYRTRVRHEIENIAVWYEAQSDVKCRVDFAPDMRSEEILLGYWLIRKQKHIDYFCTSSFTFYHPHATWALSSEFHRASHNRRSDVEKRTKTFALEVLSWLFAFINELSKEMRIVSMISVSGYNVERVCT
jgi:hypothetical protein